MTKTAFGARLSDDGASLAFAVRAPAASRVEVWLYTAATDVAPLATQSLDGGTDGTWRTTMAVASGAPLYYGYRAFGPNWPHDPAWTPGTEHGFVADCDADGNRFNPNKLLLDPYAREISHCVQTPAHPGREDYFSGPAHRAIDTGPFAPKGIIFADAGGDTGTKPTHPFKDDIVYEVHLRGLTKADPLVPEKLRGTYAGAALRAPYLRDLGVTAIEFLPLHQTQNALNDDPAHAGDQNYWGYQTMGFFAPDRRHASDRTPGGAVREFKAMVKAFHDAGLKVFLDVVYNHTEEGGLRETPEARTIYTFRGLDNARYHETRRGQGHPELYEDDNGVGPNFNAAEPIVRDLVLDSLAYWTNEMGVDGFRFDLAAVLGNANHEGGIRFDRDDPNNILNRAVRELPARPAEGGAGVDLVAEPYAVSMDAQEQGNFPRGWAEWNDRFRDTVRASQNKLGFVPVPPSHIVTRVAGSQDMFGARDRKPGVSVNYVVVHDGFTLADLHGFDAKQNDLPWPFGPSDGGRSSEDEMGWDHGGDVCAQQQAVRTSLALLAVSAGVPLITGGSEFHRTQHGNNNAYNLDTVASWLDWSLAQTHASHLAFTRKLLHFRRAHPALRPADFFTGRVGKSGIKDVTWLRDDGAKMDSAYFEDAGNQFVAWQIDGAPAGDPAGRLYIAYNGWTAPIRATLPLLPDGERWHLAVDTAAAAIAWENAHEAGAETPILGMPTVDGRSLIVAIAKTG